MIDERMCPLNSPASVSVIRIITLLFRDRTLLDRQAGPERNVLRAMFCASWVGSQLVGCGVRLGLLPAVSPIVIAGSMPLRK
jgi:hypothetical protein